MRTASSKLAARFLAKVWVEPNTGCWLWTGARDRHGYGKFWLDGAAVRAHRASYALFNGRVFDLVFDGEFCVLHKCDTPACVNPSHLWLGTQAENADDRDRKGRRRPPRGEANGRSKLTANEVRQIRDLRFKLTAREIGRLYGVAARTVDQIHDYQIWRHVA